MLREYIRQAEEKGESLKGNEIYKKFAEMVRYDTPLRILQVELSNQYIESLSFLPFLARSSAQNPEQRG